MMEIYKKCRKYRAVIVKANTTCQLEKSLNSAPDHGRPPSIVELDMVEAHDPFITKCETVTTYSVAEKEKIVCKSFK